MYAVSYAACTMISSGKITVHVNNVLVMSIQLTTYLY